MKRYVILAYVLATAGLGFSQTAERHNLNGLSKHRAKDYTGAILDFNKSIRLDPSFTAAYYHRGLSKIELRDNLGAIADF